jgi:hypothetical protein
MTGGGTERHIDQIVKARWLAVGLSHADLAEVLGLAFQKDERDGNGSVGVSTGRLMQVAEALELSPEFFRSLSAGTGQRGPDVSSTEQSLLGLRLLQAFNDLRDRRTKRLLIHLAEQMAKRQADCHGDAG